MSESYPYCICTAVDEKALKVLLESGAVKGGGSYKDSHPWIVAREFLAAAKSAQQRLPVLFASGHPAEFSHWAYIEELSVVELHRASWETVCAFSRLQPVNPIWTALDSIFLKPSAEQLARESREFIHQHRYPLTNGELHPYAICETPAFITSGIE